MARPWQIDLALRCPHCARIVDVTVELGHRAAGHDRAKCPYCQALLLQDRTCGPIVSIGKHG